MMSSSPICRSPILILVNVAFLEMGSCSSDQEENEERHTGKKSCEDIAEIGARQLQAGTPRTAGHHQRRGGSRGLYLASQRESALLTPCLQASASRTAGK